MLIDVVLSRSGLVYVEVIVVAGRNGLVDDSLLRMDGSAWCRVNYSILMYISQHSHQAKARVTAASGDAVQCDIMAWSCAQVQKTENKVAQGGGQQRRRTA